MNEVRGLYQQMQQLETYLKTTNLEPQLRHLVKMRASQINGCAYCMAMHTEEAFKDGERADRLSLLSAWRESTWFTPREQAALTWTEVLTDISRNHVTDEIYAQVRQEFGEKDLSDLTLLIIAINGWNRIAIPFRAEPKHFELPVPEAVAAD
jgi:AhpD family alkylhydroperoxidase